MAFFALFALSLLLFVAGEIIRPKPEIEDARPAGLGDFNFPTATEGRPIPLLWGTAIQEAPNVMWYGDIEREAITDEIRTSIFSKRTVIVGYEYRIGMQLGLCRGPGVVVDKIWVNDKDIGSSPTGDGGTITVNTPNFYGGVEGNGGIDLEISVFGGNSTSVVPSDYLTSSSVASGVVVAGGTGYNTGSFGDVILVDVGTGTENPDAPAGTARALFLVTAVSGTAVTAVALINPGSYTVQPTNPVTTTGPVGGGTGCTLTLTFTTELQGEGGVVPTYKGTAYLAPKARPFYIGNSPRMDPWKLQLKRIPDGLSLGAAATVNGADANPANVLYEVITSKEWGLGRNISEVDTASFSAAGTTLATEGNGFSLLLDSKIQIADFIREIERQIDGYLHIDQLSGKWKISLARGGFDINTVPEITDGNLIKIKSISRASWEDTTNIVQVHFFDRADEFKETYALAQDMGNIAIQGNVNITATPSYPGVKDKSLANQIAWRDLRTLSFPRLRAKVVVDRTFYSVIPSDVVALTNTNFGYSKLPMRVTGIDLGDLLEGRITLDLVEDNFVFRTGSFADPGGTNWTEPSLDFIPFAPIYQMAIEAPRAFSVRDIDSSGESSNKLWCATRRIGPEFKFSIRQRNSSGTPSGAFSAAGEVNSFALIGRLKGALSSNQVQPTTSIQITSDPDIQADIETYFIDSTDLSLLGTELENLIYVGPVDGSGEYMIVSSAQVNGLDVQLNNVYRGMLDTTQKSHIDETFVFLIFGRGGLSSTTFPGTNNIEVKLIPQSLTEEMSEALATQIDFTMTNRAVKPYPPSKITLNTVDWDTTLVSLEGSGSGPEDYAIDLIFNRRDYRTADEIESLLNDLSSVNTVLPTNQTIGIEVRNISSGDVLLFSESTPFKTHTLKRITILEKTNGVIPTSLRIIVDSTHTVVEGVVSSIQKVTHDFTVTTTLTGQFNFGALDTAIGSNTYIADATVDHVFALSSAFTVGAVEYRIDTGAGFGAWLPLIAQGLTTGTITGVVATNKIEVRHQNTNAAQKRQLDMTVTGGTNAYAILFT